MVPSSWISTTIGETAELGSGSTPSRSKQGDYFDGGTIAWVKTGDLNNDLIQQTEESITQQALEESSCKIYPSGTLLVAMYGGFKQIGRTGLLGCDAAINQALTAISVDQKTACPEYVQQWLNCRVAHWQRLAGSSRKDPNITKSEVAAFPLLLPPAKEQRAIVCLLSTWDRGIRQLTDLIAAKLRFKQGLMQQLLTGKKRITPRVKHGISEPLLGSSPDNSIVSLEVEFGITGKSFQEGIPAVNICPSGWTQHSFCDLFEVVQRPAELREEATYQLVTAKRYRGGIVPREQLRGEQIKTKTQFFVATGDFLISKRQIIHGACGMVPASLDGAVVSNEYACLRPSCELDPGFLHYLIHTRYFQQTCFHASVGVTLEKMIFRLDQWLKHLVNLPPLEDQRAIADCLSTMDYEILLLARQRRLLKQQKKGMMQKLLTGEVRVKLSKGVV